VDIVARDRIFQISLLDLQIISDLLANFVANKCTLFILFLYVTLQVCKTYKNKMKSVHLLATKFTSISKMHGATHIKISDLFYNICFVVRICI
jgi:hypothetical protein